MDNIFDRAHDIIDKAQGKVANAAAQTAWTANQGLLIRNLEGQFNALQDEITRVTREIGERAYGAWKARADDPRVPALCGHLDDLQTRRDRAAADLAAARSATFDPNSYQPSAISYQQPSIAPPQPALTPPRPIPAIAPAQPPPAPVIEGTFVSSPAPPPPAQRVTAPTPPPRQPTERVSVAPATATRATVPQARECPHCGHFVPGGVEFCPSCGIRVV